jgi:predicted ferric reductase
MKFAGKWTLRARSPIFWIVVSLCVYLLIWILASLNTQVCFCWPQKKWATTLGVAGFYIFSLSLLLSSRWKKLESWFGGLDQIYQLHRRLGVWGFCLILLHPLAESLKWYPQNIEKFVLFTLPIHGRLSVNLGSLAFWLMLLIMGITLLKVLPYDKWKILHKFMSLVFILASLHIILSDKRVGSTLAQSLLYIPMGVGFLAILYKQVYIPFFSKQLLISVAEVNHINDNIVELIFAPKDNPIKFSPGQYGFFSFQGPSLSAESHPFTLVESGDGLKTSILIKARGDFTKNLCQLVKEGDIASFEGPYGRLDYTQAGNLQIWIAGGIGVVLFLAWIRAMNSNSVQEKKIDFYYCTHRRMDAVFYEEFQEFGRMHPGFRVFLYCSEEGKRLDIQKIVNSSMGISGKQVFMCGPLKLTEYFTKQFQALGMSKDDIFFENFEFF